jgi:Fe-S cluster biosynthesis and repair protein YggX
MNGKDKVFCKRLREALPALTKAPISGPIGQVILQNTSDAAWNEWFEAQMKIINEERLDLSEETAQQRLFQNMVAFLGLTELLE